MKLWYVRMFSYLVLAILAGLGLYLVAQVVIALGVTFLIGIAVGVVTTVVFQYKIKSWIKRGRY